jgi:hypothetical protein
MHGDPVGKYVLIDVETRMVVRNGRPFTGVTGTEKHEHTGYARAEFGKVFAGDGDVVDDRMVTAKYCLPYRGPARSLRIVDQGNVLVGNSISQVQRCVRQTCSAMRMNLSVGCSMLSGPPL